MKRFFIGLRIFLALVIISGSMVFRPVPAVAWEQGASGTHEEINHQAVIRFLNSMSNNPKFQNSPLDLTKTYLAGQTMSATLAQSGFRIAQNSLKFEDWLPHGGFSADEPEIWACVRHFYDPLSINGDHQLTDHSWLHGAVYDAISAKQWAFNDVNNPYSWFKAMDYYKTAMEIPEDAKITAVPGTDFRDPAIAVTSNEQARNVYLGKAFRALGETMHMMADLTQPAHVRNDSHPNGDLDPIESTANRNTVLLVKDSPVDPAAEAAIASAASAADMYESIALFTNRNFYTDDTIYDKASGLNPRNWESPYPHPQFSDLILDKSSSQKTYYKEFNGKKVRMAQQTYTSWKIGDKYWQDYIVPPSFMVEQAEVLMPIAIRANAKLINNFFPTMDLKIEVKPGATKTTDANYREFTIASPFKHMAGDDPDWQKNALTIQYSGPGELWVESGSNARKLGNLSYKGGALEKPAAVFVGDKSNAKADLYQVNDKDKIYIVINAGGRTFQSNKYTISTETSITISPPEITLAPGGRQTFTVQLTGPGSSQATWSIDEGPTGGDINSAFGIYTAPAKTGIYHVTAVLNSDKTRKATAVVTVSSVVVTIKPPTATVAPKGTQAFTADVTGNPEKGVTWKVEETGGGTITAEGLYTAPDKGGPYHIVATSKADSKATAKATAVLSTPAVPTIGLNISPTEMTLAPGGKQEFRASLSGIADTKVNWGVPGAGYMPPQAVDIPVTFVATTVGDYLVSVTSVADPTKKIEAKVHVVPGIWVFVNKTEKTYPNIGSNMPAPSGGVTLGNGSATATNQTTMTSKWSFTWAVPPTTLPVGQKLTGTLSVKDAGSSYDSKQAQYPLGHMEILLSGNSVMFAAGRDRTTQGYPFVASASRDYSITVPAGTTGGPQMEIIISVIAEANFGQSTVYTQEIGEVHYFYELRPTAP
jgi:hypothetical protein